MRRQRQPERQSTRRSELQGRRLPAESESRVELDCRERSVLLNDAGPPDSIETVLSQSGLDAAESHARLTTIKAACQAQADAALTARSGIDASDLGEFYAWAKTNRQGQLQEAIQMQVRLHDVAGYKTLASESIASTAPSEQALKAAGIPIRAQGHGSEIFIRGQWMSASAAAKAGLIWSRTRGPPPCGLPGSLRRHRESRQVRPIDGRVEGVKSRSVGSAPTATGALQQQGPTKRIAVRAHLCTHTMHPHRPETLANAGFQEVGWLMGLEPTTTGITILDSTN